MNRESWNVRCQKKNNKDLSCLKLQASNFKNRGFTLIELLVVISIFIIITSIAVFSNSQFNSSVILSNLAYEVALSVREAQNYGISVHSASSGCSNEGCLNSSYGVDFNTNNNMQYILFNNLGSIGSNGLYTYANYTYISGPSTNAVTTFSLGHGFTIRSVNYSSDDTHWTSLINQPLDISFVRPNPNAIFYINGSQSLSTEEAEICIQDPTESHFRGIIVGSTGQISVVNDTSCN
ncbi:MAG TPA: prepilin-type N-terminal cleavage/methylation domain-containing protein [Candidatus Paceibacterota bacterium]|nr:prepilin-type N-terminal cleavage/methylation domain-containing protein [Candidatus Paceibacterota bacterium]